jgi:hypothetical protein
MTLGDLIDIEHESVGTFPDGECGEVAHRDCVSNAEHPVKRPDRA